MGSLGWLWRLRCWIAVAVIGALQRSTSTAIVTPAKVTAVRPLVAKPAASSVIITARQECRCNSWMVTTMSAIGNYRVRPCRGGEDYVKVIGSVDGWWGGRRMSVMLPRLFFDNFCDTSFVVVLADGEGEDRHPSTTGSISTAAAAPPPRPPAAAEGKESVVGFLCGFISQSRVGEAHAHFVGIDPAHRGSGLGEALYERFFEAVAARGCTLVHAVTSPSNTASVAFHKKLGFALLPVVGSGRVDEEERTGDGDWAALEGAAQGQGVSRKFVHVDWDGPDDGDRVLLEKRL